MEQVYKCTDCGSHYPESSVTLRPISNTPYCRLCQCEALEPQIDNENQIEEIE